VSIKWFSTQARTKPFKGNRPVKKKPVAPSAPKPKYKSQAPTQRLPKLQKPKVDVPFIEAPRQVGKLVVADERDPSSFACMEMVEIVESRGLGIDRITWNKNSGSGDDDGLCARLASRAWPDFDALFAEQSNKPEKYRRRDMREGYEADGIIGVSHPGCHCYLKVFLDDGSVWKITTMDMKPSMISSPTKQQAPVEPSIDEFETDVTEVEPGESEEEV
jgi:hypothetical protein